MVGCILTGHGKFAEGLADALTMIGGPQEEFETVLFLEEDAALYPEHLTNAIATMVERNNECVVFCDLLGGTPFNQSMLAGATLPNVSVVAGANLPMLLEAVCGRDASQTAQDVVASAEFAGKAGVAYKKLELSEEQTDDLFEDGI